ncbi:hypothetical protein A4A49_34243 [Nicotiana attenuata]|uniref:Uncharacterized protein n=1 Tax=Nicotiana attenuata TaxID=49451 RepID=A0A1J6IIG1_NICAT|nr:hypothetical protein A4A49_34243 [Nicotiana attenuata]
MLKNSISIALLLLLEVLLAIAIHTSADKSFDVRQHLSTVSRYDIVKDISDNSFVPSQIPDQCTPIHLNLVVSLCFSVSTGPLFFLWCQMRIDLEILSCSCCIFFKKRAASCMKLPAFA